MAEPFDEHKLTAQEFCRTFDIMETRTWIALSEVLEDHWDKGFAAGQAAERKRRTEEILRFLRLKWREVAPNQYGMAEMYNAIILEIVDEFLVPIEEAP